MRKHNSYDSYVISEKDFYPPIDDRVLKSIVEDIEGGDNFFDYSCYIYDLYEDEDLYEN